MAYISGVPQQLVLVPIPGDLQVVQRTGVDIACEQSRLAFSEHIAYYP